ncbi:MAG: proline dehydrogenase family protein, partial [Candidatus Omnitrophica bacterium]|nr:proline dehydrogenase family protein [Candidatus Omnitrophota bacterium]
MKGALKLFYYAQEASEEVVVGRDSYLWVDIMLNAGRSYLGLVVIYTCSDRYDNAHIYCEKALAIAGDILQSFPQNRPVRMFLGKLHMARQNTYEIEGKDEKAELEHRRAVAINQQLLLEESGYFPESSSPIAIGTVLKPFGDGSQPEAEVSPGFSIQSSSPVPTFEIDELFETERILQSPGNASLLSLGKQAGLSALQWQELRTKYNGQIQAGHIDNKHCGITDDGQIYVIRSGMNQAVLSDRGALYCNYVLIWTPELARKGALIHTYVNAWEDAVEILQEACQMISLFDISSQRILSQQVYAIILRAEDAQLNPDDQRLCAATEQAFTTASMDLKLKLLPTDAHVAWYKNIVRLLVDEGLMLAIARDSAGLRVIHSLSLEERIQNNSPGAVWERIPDAAFSPVGTPDVFDFFLEGVLVLRATVSAGSSPVSNQGSLRKGHRWCPACGNHSILAALKKAIDTSAHPNENIVIISDIGCAARMYMSAGTLGIDTAQTLYGRSLGFSGLINLADPSLLVIVIIGDGGFGMALNDLKELSTKTRNVKVIVVNNKVIGMTGGQDSITTPAELRVQDTSYAPTDICGLAKELGAHWTGKASAEGGKGSTEKLSEGILEAITHPGVSVLEVASNCPQHIPRKQRKKQRTDKGKNFLPSGNEVIAQVAVQAGCDCFVGHPITPSTSILEYIQGLLEEAGGIWEQTDAGEDAIMPRITVASWLGRVVMTATSGPGFDRMQEGIGYAVATNTPMVIVDVMRGGPSTGLPTRPSQEDVMSAIYGGHGDQPRIVLAVSSADECVNIISRAFRLAYKYHAVVIVLSDAALANTRRPLVIPQTLRKIIGRRTFGAGAMVCKTGLINLGGQPRDDSDSVHLYKERLRNKIVGRCDIEIARRYYTNDAEVVFVCYGSIVPAALEVVLWARSCGLKFGLLKLNTLSPFPDNIFTGACANAQKIIVPELNQGQFVREVQAAVNRDFSRHIDVVGIGYTTGTLLSPRKLLEIVSGFIPEMTIGLIITDTQKAFDPEIKRIGLVGSGGQGLELMARLLALAALDEKKYPVVTHNYGAEVQGGPSDGMLIIGSKKAIYPEPQELEMMVAFDLAAYQRNRHLLGQGAMVVIDSGRVKLDEAERAFLAAGNIRLIEIPFLRAAKEKLDNEKVANVVALGALCRLTEIVSLEAVARAVERQFEGTEKNIGINHSALSEGSILAEGIASSPVGTPDAFDFFLEGVYGVSGKASSSAVQVSVFASDRGVIQRWQHRTENFLAEQGIPVAKSLLKETTTCFLETEIDMVRQWLADNRHMFPINNIGKVAKAALQGFNGQNRVILVDPEDVEVVMKQLLCAPGIEIRANPYAQQVNDAVRTLEINRRYPTKQVVSRTIAGYSGYLDKLLNQEFVTKEELQRWGVAFSYLSYIGGKVRQAVSLLKEEGCPISRFTLVKISRRMGRSKEFLGHVISRKHVTVKMRRQWGIPDRSLKNMVMDAVAAIREQGGIPTQKAVSLQMGYHRLYLYRKLKARKVTKTQLTRWGVCLGNGKSERQQIFLNELEKNVRQAVTVLTAERARPTRSAVSKKMQRHKSYLHDCVIRKKVTNRRLCAWGVLILVPPSGLSKEALRRKVVRVGREIRSDGEVPSLRSASIRLGYSTSYLQRIISEKKVEKEELLSWLMGDSLWFKNAKDPRFLVWLEREVKKAARRIQRPNAKTKTAVSKEMDKCPHYLKTLVGRKVVTNEQLRQWGVESKRGRRGVVLDIPQLGMRIRKISQEMKEQGVGPIKTKVSRKLGYNSSYLTNLLQEGKLTEAQLRRWGVSSPIKTPDAFEFTLESVLLLSKKMAASGASSPANLSPEEEGMRIILSDIAKLEGVGFFGLGKRLLDLTGWFGSLVALVTGTQVVSIVFNRKESERLLDSFRQDLREMGVEMHEVRIAWVATKQAAASILSRDLVNFDALVMDPLYLEYFDGELVAWAHKKLNGRGLVITLGEKAAYIDFTNRIWRAATTFASSPVEESAPGMEGAAHPGLLRLMQKVLAATDQNGFRKTGRNFAYLLHRIELSVRDLGREDTLPERLNIRRRILGPVLKRVAITFSEAIKELQEDLKSNWIIELPLTLEQLTQILDNYEERGFVIFRDERGRHYLYLIVGGGFGELMGIPQRAGVFASDIFDTGEATGHSHPRYSKVEPSEGDYADRDDSEELSYVMPNFILCFDGSIRMSIQRPSETDFEEIYGEDNVVRELSKLGILRVAPRGAFATEIGGVDPHCGVSSPVQEENRNVPIFSIFTTSCPRRAFMALVFGGASSIPAIVSLSCASKRDQRGKLISFFQNEFLVFFRWVKGTEADQLRGQAVRGAIANLKAAALDRIGDVEFAELTGNLAEGIIEGQLFVPDGALFQRKAHVAWQRLTRQYLVPANLYMYIWGVEPLLLKVIKKVPYHSVGIAPEVKGSFLRVLPINPGEHIPFQARTVGYNDFYLFNDQSVDRLVERIYNALHGDRFFITRANVRELPEEGGVREFYSRDVRILEIEKLMVELFRRDGLHRLSKEELKERVYFVMEEHEGRHAMDFSGAFEGMVNPGSEEISAYIFAGVYSDPSLALSFMIAPFLNFPSLSEPSKDAGQKKEAFRSALRMGVDNGYIPSGFISSIESLGTAKESDDIERVMQDFEVLPQLMRHILNSSRQEYQAVCFDAWRSRFKTDPARLVIEHVIDQSRYTFYRYLPFGAGAVALAALGSVIYGGLWLYRRKGHIQEIKIEAARHALQEALPEVELDERAFKEFIVALSKGQKDIRHFLLKNGISVGKRKLKEIMRLYSRKSDTERVPTPGASSPAQEENRNVPIFSRVRKTSASSPAKEDDQGPFEYNDITEGLSIHDSDFARNIDCNLREGEWEMALFISWYSGSIFRFKVMPAFVRSGGEQLRGGHRGEEWGETYVEPVTVVSGEKVLRLQPRQASAIRGAICRSSDKPFGFVRLDPPKSKQDFLKRRLNKSVLAAVDEGLYERELGAEIVGTVEAIVSQGINPKKKLVIFDSIREIFVKRGYPLPAEFTVGEFLGIIPAERISFSPFSPQAQNVERTAQDGQRRAQDTSSPAQAMFRGKDRYPPIEEEIKEVARDIYSQVDKIAKSRRIRWHPVNLMMRWVRRNEFTKIRMLAFIKLLRSIGHSNRSITRHIPQYFPVTDQRLPLGLRTAAMLARSASLFYPVGPWIVGKTTRSLVYFMANYFFIGNDIESAKKGVTKKHQEGFRVTVDPLGEAVMCEEEAKEYVVTCLALLDALAGTLPTDVKPNISIKLTSLYSEFNPIDPVETKKRVKEGLRVILRKVREVGGIIWIDMEQYAYKDLTLEIFKEILEEDEFNTFSDAGIVIQAYLKDSREDLAALHDWAERRRVPVWVRLVKGAYWEYEVAIAQQNDWPISVFMDKNETDARFEEMTRYLLENRQVLRPAFATHNVRSMACAITVAKRLSIYSGELELQFLTGLGNVKAQAIRAMGSSLKALFYGPFGLFITGMRYFARRLLESGSSASVLNLEDQSSDREEMIKSPKEKTPLAMTSSRDAEDAAMGLYGGPMPIAPSQVARRVLARCERLVNRDPSRQIERYVRIVQRLASEQVRISQTPPRFIRQVPGEPVEYIYFSLGEGIIIACEGTSPEELISFLAAALITENEVAIKAGPEHRELIRRLQRSRVLPGKIRFVDNEQDSAILARQWQWKWVVALGEKCEVDAIRCAVYRNLTSQDTLKKVIPQMRPAPLQLKEFLIAKTIVSNTMHSGYTPPLSDDYTPDFRNTPTADFSDPRFRADYQAAVDAVKAEIRGGKYRDIPLNINGREIRTEEKGTSLCPSHSHMIVGRFSQAQREHVEEAVVAAEEAFRVWKDVPEETRKKVLLCIGERIRESSLRFAALMNWEVAKNWEEAMGDVEEAVDMANYYALQPEYIREELKKYLVEFKEFCPCGIAAVIAPWNFPLAILCGMALGVMVSGNTVILKPASQASVIAYEFFMLVQGVLKEFDLPLGIFNYLPGPGSQVGSMLASHPKVDIIAFTGSFEVGAKILEAAAESESQREHPKQIILELGGKNASIIDESADIDEGVMATAPGSFGFAGQKCSADTRKIVFTSISEAFEGRLVQRVRSLRIGYAEEPGVFLTAVIDEHQREKIEGFIEQAKNDRRIRVVYEYPLPAGLAQEGFFMAPIIFETSDPDVEIFQEEIFGPVLTIVKVKSIQEAIKIANYSRFSLTGGIISQTPRHIEMIKQRLKACVIYINRKITGAKVGQPFGGNDHSGLGSRAAGPDYVPWGMRFTFRPDVYQNTLEPVCASFGKVSGEGASSPAAGEEQAAWGIWPAPGLSLDPFVRFMAQNSFSDVVWVNPDASYVHRNLSTLYELHQQKPLTEMPGIFMAAPGWCSLDLPFISGLTINEFIESDTYPKMSRREEREQVDNADTDKAFCIVRSIKGGVIVERPRALVRELLLLGMAGLRRTIFRPADSYECSVNFSRKSGVVGLWYGNYLRLRQAGQLPVITFLNARDFSMGFVYPQVYADRGLSLNHRGVIRREAVMASEFAQKASNTDFVARLDLHEFREGGAVDGLRDLLVDGTIVEEFSRVCGSEVNLLENENRDIIDPWSSSKDGPVLYVRVPGSHSSSPAQEENRNVPNSPQRKSFSPWQDFSLKRLYFVAMHFVVFCAVAYFFMKRAFPWKQDSIRSPPSHAHIGYFFKKAINDRLKYVFHGIEVVCAVIKYTGVISFVTVLVIGYPFWATVIAIIFTFAGGISRFSAALLYQWKYPDIPLQRLLHPYIALPFGLGYSYGMSVLMFPYLSYKEVMRLRNIAYSLRLSIHYTQGLTRPQLSTVKQDILSIAERILHYEKGRSLKPLRIRSAVLDRDNVTKIKRYLVDGNPVMLFDSAERIERFREQTWLKEEGVDISLLYYFDVEALYASLSDVCIKSLFSSGSDASSPVKTPDVYRFSLEGVRDLFGKVSAAGVSSPLEMKYLLGLDFTALYQLGVPQTEVPPEIYLFNYDGMRLRVVSFVENNLIPKSLYMQQPFEVITRKVLELLSPVKENA